MISQSLLLELKKILEEDFRLNLTMQEVTKMGVALLGYFETLAQIEKKTSCINKSKPYGK